MKKLNFSTTIWILFYLLIFSFLLYNSFSYLDPDLGWHLKVGGQIIQEKAVPDFEYYDYTLEGKKWVDHEWLFNVITFWIYNNFGYLALNLFFAGIILITLIILQVFTQKCILNGKQKSVVVMFFQFFGALAMAPHLGVRMQEITILNLLLLLIIIHQFDRKKNMRVLFWLLPLFYFWACAHAGFLIGIFIMFFWLGIQIIKIIIRRQTFFSGTCPCDGSIIPPHHNAGQAPGCGAKMRIAFDNLHNGSTGLSPLCNRRGLSLFCLFACLSVGATFFTPYGIKLYSFLSGYSDTFFMKHIAEWLPAYYWPIQYKQLVYLAIAATVFILLICYSWRGSRDGSIVPKGCGAKVQAVDNGLRHGSTAPLRRRLWSRRICLYLHKKIAWDKIDLWYFILSLFFLFLAFKAKRHFPLFFIASFPLLIKFCSQYITFPPKISIIFKNNIFIKIYIIIGFLLAISGFLLKTNFTSNPFISPIFCRSYPCAAINFLKGESQYNDLNIFNPYSWGGFIIWAYPERKLFIDGRLPQYKFAGHTFLQEYYEFFDEEKTEEKLNQYNIKLVLLKLDKDIKINWFEKYILGMNEEKINDQENYLKNYLEMAQNWELVYNDDISNVYVKDK